MISFNLIVLYDGGKIKFLSIYRITGIRVKFVMHACTDLVELEDGLTSWKKKVSLNVRNSRFKFCMRIHFRQITIELCYRYIFIMLIRINDEDDLRMQKLTTRLSLKIYIRL